MKIAIDLNEVYRAYTSQFAIHYKKYVDQNFDIDNVEIWTNDLKQVFPFASKDKYLDFLYNEYPQEIFAFAPPMDKDISVRLNDWLKEIENLDETPEVCVVSSQEYGKSIGSSLFFLAKYATKIREIYMLMDANEIWNKCDVVITANTELLTNIPEGKKAIKIEAMYNTEIETDLTYSSFMDFLNDKNIIELLQANK
jgi:hypothetical protein